jgi:hypothetical protein
VCALSLAVLSWWTRADVWPIDVHVSRHEAAGMTEATGQSTRLSVMRCSIGKHEASS